MSETLKAGQVVDVGGVLWALCSDVEVEAPTPAQPYPKLLWSADGQEVTVKDADEEAAKLAEGYRVTAAPVAVSEPTPELDNKPTFGAADDPTYGDDKPKNKKKG